MYDRSSPRNFINILPSSKVLSATLLSGCLLAGASFESAAQSESTSAAPSAAEKEDRLGVESLKLVRARLGDLEALVRPLVEMDSKHPGSITTLTNTAAIREQLEDYSSFLLAAERLDFLQAPERKDARIKTTGLVIGLSELSATLTSENLSTNWSAIVAGKKNSPGGLKAIAAMGEVNALSLKLVTEIAKRPGDVIKNNLRQP